MVDEIFEIVEPQEFSNNAQEYDEYEPCDYCGGRVKWLGGTHYYNGSYNCLTGHLECENCGTYDVECV